MGNVIGMRRALRWVLLCLRDALAVNWLLCLRNALAVNWLLYLRDALAVNWLLCLRAALAVNWLLCLRDALVVNWLSRQPRSRCRSYIWVPHGWWTILGLPGRGLQVSLLRGRMRLPRHIALLWPCLGLAVLRGVVLSACHAVVEGVLASAI